MEEKRADVLRTAKKSILGNTLIALVKGTAGVFGNSYALIADAIESTTDVFSSLMLLIGLRYSTKPADDNHPYGHGKIEPLMTFMIVILLVISATVIAVKSIDNIQTPHKAPAPFTLIVLAVIVIVKEVFYRLISRKSNETQSSSLKAEAWHHRSDAITSLAAFIGIGIAVLMGEGYEAADDWAALLASGIILFNAFLLLRPALGEIMDEHVHEELIEEVRIIASKVEGVQDTEKCYARKNGMLYHVDLHLIVKGSITVRHGHEIAHEVKDKVMGQLPEISDVLIHIEPD
ncbi:cation diffusion facilitator family transporter [Algivirga pacifica]|uniref:Cation diffusion facilitator family transporter n=1 Tax=Algivirga pacifica TaxID=1162670 RepID=A0ABP9DJD8_9BACT